MALCCSGVLRAIVPMGLTQHGRGMATIDCLLLDQAFWLNITAPMLGLMVLRLNRAIHLLRMGRLNIWRIALMSLQVKPLT
jgi:hypothetical protein